MKLFFSEFTADYSKYHFPYQVWLLREAKDELEKIYAAGFLPIRSLQNVYYLTRSVRVEMSLFAPSSENRRILKKTEGIETDLIPLAEFDYTPDIQKFCKDYGKRRLGKGFLSAAAIRKIFKGKTFNYVFVFKEIKTQNPVGFAVCFIAGKILHYAHAFYDIEHLAKNLGARMMLQAVLWAKENQKGFVYLGTCYEKSSLYKTEFKGVEFFNGFRWVNNQEELQFLLEQPEKKEEEYLLRNKEYLERFYQKELLSILSNYGVRVNL